MLWLSTLLVALAMAPITAIAGHSLANSYARSRRHRSHSRDIALNVSRGHAPQAKAGPMALQDKYAGQSFFDEWDFFTAADPTDGNVEYVSKDEAISSGLAFVDSKNVAVIAVDDKNNMTLNGNRKSVRISSQNTYNGGLFVMDANAVPTGCATWPAFWTKGDKWPTNGEIDIVEGVNTQTNNLMSLHTTQGCTLDTLAPAASPNAMAFLGSTDNRTDCDHLVADNAGCGFTDSDPGSFGAGVEIGGGAVFAMLWDSIGIRVWHFDRSNTPADLTAFAPNPSTWPIPSAFWSTETCPVDQFFGPHKIIINTSLCGKFAGNAYSNSGCPGTCAERVADPENFHDAKWKINYVATYQ